MDFRIRAAGVRLSGRSVAWQERVEKGTEEQEWREMGKDPAQLQASG